MQSRSASSSAPAPSTSLIMRSRKVEPGAAVMRTRIQSESVPCSAGDCRSIAARLTMTPALPFAVIAASLTRSDTLNDLTIGRNDVGGLDQDDVSYLQVPYRRRVETLSGITDASTLACVPVRCRRRSACALPRPSATASAKLANKTVNHSHTTISNSDRNMEPAVEDSRQNDRGQHGDHLHANMTRFVASVRGSSLTKAAPIADATIFGSSNAETGRVLRIVEVSINFTPIRI